LVERQRHQRRVFQANAAEQRITLLIVVRLDLHCEAFEESRFQTFPVRSKKLAGWGIDHCESELYVLGGLGIEATKAATQQLTWVNHQDRFLWRPRTDSAGVRIRRTYPDKLHTGRFWAKCEPVRPSAAE
jgi:hypothetical protein